ncbi:hypothetical protein FRC14_006358 [Serendipita sp. 396]|nr:hypothetical protein FRC14_006358 [Serendipita sp. 396]KAG8783186.1 hypothetical protein FRC15_005681 [Serendipita sp. 397]KAG8799082.1 hypothetical protein FRC16_005851 [Serendipita sp. 398]KAG8830887.1 hypothetical protein FRC18_007417 [Serendipita sp. 400]KAG8867489.1 hypothetical protein FRC20_005613 [Serendipita sp. 405]KAG9053342.1 hypothetical protein FS842_008328 [Serendipita sp. 407]
MHLTSLPYLSADERAVTHPLAIILPHIVFPHMLATIVPHIFFPNLSGTVDTFRLLHPIRQQTTIRPSVATTVVEIAPDAARVAPDAPKPAMPAANVSTSSPSVSDSSFAAKAATATAIAIAVVPIVTVIVNLMVFGFRAISPRQCGAAKTRVSPGDGWTF